MNQRRTNNPNASDGRPYEYGEDGRYPNERYAPDSRSAPDDRYAPTPRRDGYAPDPAGNVRGENNPAARRRGPRRKKKKENLALKIWHIIVLAIGYGTILYFLIRYGIYYYYLLTGQ